jgi:hypothetical protein
MIPIATGIIGTITIGMIGAITIETTGVTETNELFICSGSEIRGREGEVVLWVRETDLGSRWLTGFGHDETSQE